MPEKEVYVDRYGFMTWTKGVLLDFKMGSGFVADKKEYYEVEPCLQAGGKVFLTVQGKPVTKLVMTEAGYEERPLKALKRKRKRG